MARTITPAKFKSFFAGPEGWGSLQQTRADGKQVNEIHVGEGQVVVGEVRLAPPAGVKQVNVMAGKMSSEIAVTVTVQPDGVLVKFAKPIVVKAGEKLTITLSAGIANPGFGGSY